MKGGKSRRSFLKQFTQLGFSCLSLLIWNERILAKTSDQDKTKEELTDLKKRSYCGIACENECELYKATKENNTELKKKLYEKWNWKERFGLDFDPDKVFCYNCKPENNLYKIGMGDCEVRKCAIKNKIESCIQCKNLVSCEKEFWNQWEKFYEHVKELQKQYLTQNGANLIEIKKKM